MDFERDVESCVFGIIFGDPMNMENDELSFHLEIFDGPLDLLLSLISKNKVNIYDIPISLIFSQYMEYIETLQRMDMDVAGEFLEMASRLMLIKSRMLLPRATDNKEDDHTVTDTVYNNAPCDDFVAKGVFGADTNQTGQPVFPGEWFILDFVLIGIVYAAVEQTVKIIWFAVCNKRTDNIGKDTGNHSYEINLITVDGELVRIHCPLDVGMEWRRNGFKELIQSFNHILLFEPGINVLCPCLLDNNTGD